jgi:hypothetical protein
MFSSVFRSENAPKCAGGWEAPERPLHPTYPVFSNALIGVENGKQRGTIE